MKKIIIIFATIIALLIMFSCQKQKDNSIYNKAKNNDIQLVKLYDNSKNSVTLLEFSSIDHFEATIASLNAQISALEDTLISHYGHLSDDSLNHIIEALNYNEYQPLIDFENYYHIPSSMRQVYMSAKMQWLNNSTLDESLDPQKIYDLSMAEMTLLNPEGEVKIGTNLLKLTNKGFVYITNEDVTTLIRIKNGDRTAYNEPTVTTNIDLSDDGDKSGDCKKWKNKEIGHTYASNKKVIMHVHYHVYPWKATANAKISSYQKKNNKWKNYKMTMSVCVQDYLYDTNCDQLIHQQFSGWNTKKKATLEQGNHIWSSFPIQQAKKGASVQGIFVYSGNNNNLWLTW